MTPGERCDEIVRLIDETLSACPPAALPTRRAKERAKARAEAEIAEVLAKSA